MHSSSTRPAAPLRRAALCLVLALLALAPAPASASVITDAPPVTTDAPPVSTVSSGSTAPSADAGVNKILMSSQKMHQRVSIVEGDITLLMKTEARPHTADKVLTCFKHRAYGCKPEGYVATTSGEIVPVYESNAVNEKMIWSFFDCVAERVDELESEVPALSSAGAALVVDPTGEAPTVVREAARSAAPTVYRVLQAREVRPSRWATRRKMAMPSVVRRRDLPFSFFCARDYCCEFVAVSAERKCLEMLCGRFNLPRKDLCR